MPPEESENVKFEKKVLDIIEKGFHELAKKLKTFSNLSSCILRPRSGQFCNHSLPTRVILDLTNTTSTYWLQLWAIDGTGAATAQVWPAAGTFFQIPAASIQSDGSYDQLVSISGMVSGTEYQLQLFVGTPPASAPISIAVVTAD
jgi:hypothetical protein